MKKIRNIWKKVKIRNQIILTYITILLVSFALTFSLISAINNKYTKTEIGDVSMQTVDALQGNMSYIFDNVTQFSTLTYFDDTIQESLDQISTESINVTYQKTITKSLFNMLLSGEYISGVFIFDKYNNCYNSCKKTPKSIKNKMIGSTKWYKKMEQSNGNGFFYDGSDGIVEYYVDNNYLCYVRQIYNKNTYKPLATLLITFDDEVLQDYFTQVSEAHNSQFYIVDSTGKYIIEPSNRSADYTPYTKAAIEMGNGYKQVSVDDKKSIIVSQSMDIQDWSLVGIFPMDGMEKMAPYYSTVLITIMILNALFVFICSMFLTSWIFKPLAKVEKQMRIVENGRFEMMEIGDAENEITSLKKGFNHMVKSVKDLMEKVKDEEQIIAKGKLDIIQAQINPHFLYNTLDAVAALVLMGENEKCFEMTQAMGNFYRNSLNSGLDFISVEDEIDCIRNYIIILNMRYDNHIQVNYDIEEGIKKVKILKLILQPLVENAVHHGLNGDEGTINIRAFEQDKEIIFIVSDDGNGMSEERIHDVLEGKTVTGKSGFGIHSLIQRLQLFYGIDNPMIIQSEQGIGTEIIIIVKKI